MQRRRILLLSIWLTLIAGAVEAGPTSQTVWSGLVIANNVAQPEPVPPELTKSGDTLKELFGYNQFTGIGQSHKPLVTGSAGGMAHSKYLSLIVDSKERNDSNG